MVRTIFLLSPIFVCLFWSVLLMESSDKYSYPKRFLSKFMLVSLVIFTSHFFYFASYPEIYVWFDFALILTGLSAFPIYHIYFRLLTVDKKFSLKTHYKYLLVPGVVSIAYLTAILIVPKNEYGIWLFNENHHWTSFNVGLLSIMRIIIKLTFIFLLIKALILNRFLIKKYGYKAGEFYSDMEDVRNKNLKLLDYSMIAISLASFVAEALGRSMILSNEYYIFIIWTVFSVSLYFMGLLGFRQKPINPLFEGNETGAQSITEIDSSSILKDKDYIRIRIVEEFNNNKLYLNSELSIIELAEAVGTNRSYVSSAINQNYSQNFCTFVNSFRITELERVFVENPEFTTEKMAEICGFGSVNSMKRAVSFKTGLAFSDFRKKIQSSYPDKS